MLSSPQSKGFISVVHEDYVSKKLPSCHAWLAEIVVLNLDVCYMNGQLLNKTDLYVSEYSMYCGDVLLHFAVI